MDDSIESVEIGLQSYSPEVGRERGLEILTHVDEYDVPAADSNRVSNLADLEVASVDRAQYAFADPRRGLVCPPFPRACRLPPT